MKGETLISQFSNHIDQLHADQTRLFNYIIELEHLVEEYRAFVSRSELSTMDNVAAKLVLLAKTDKIVGPVPKELQKEDPSAPIGGLYRYEVDRDAAEKKKRESQS